LRGTIRKILVQQAKLIYGAEDAEYYAGVVWAQILGMTHFFLMVSMLIGAVLNQILITGICLIFTVVIIYYFSTKMKNQIKERSDQCTNELPEVVSSLALLINSGMILKNAWKTVAYSKDAEIYSLMKESCVEIENGVDEKNAIYRFGMKTNSVSVKKFTSVLCQGIEKGGSELITILMQQSSEMWSLKKQLMLQKGEEANAKILAPVALMFLGIIIIIITGSIGLMF
jgi:tight adherence protein C